MFGWILQWYVNVPADVNVWLYVAPGVSVSLVVPPVSMVTVWPTVSWFVQVTEPPTLTLIVAGPKAKFWIVTADAAAPAEVPLEALADGAAADADAEAAGAEVAGAIEAGVGVVELEHAPRARAPTNIISRIGRCTGILRLALNGV